MVKKMLVLSVLLLSAMAGSAFAFDIPALYTSIQVNPGGRGDVLVAPLYDVRDLDGKGQQTYINIVNTDPDYGVVVRIRFREFKRSDEVLDFHIPLSKGDVWSGVIYKSINGRAYLYSDDFNTKDINFATDTFWPLRHDTNVLDSLIPGDPSDPFGGKGVPFSTFNTSGNVARTLYGYFEIIGEERVAGVFGAAQVNRVPLTEPANDLCPEGGRGAQNSLFGETWLVRVEQAVSHQYQDTAISNFSVDPAGIADSIIGFFPNLQNDAQGEGLNPGFGGFEQLEFVLSKRSIFVQFFNDPDLGATTSVVVTFPTKHFHFASSGSFPILGGDSGTPFVGPFETIQDGAADRFSFVVRNRAEEILTERPDEPIFSPVPPGETPFPRWPYEVNIVGIYNQLVTPPIFRDNAAIFSFDADQLFKSGYVDIDLAADGQGDTGDYNFFCYDPAAIPPVSCANFFGYAGLPAIGVVLTEYINAAIGPVGGYFGGAIPWAYSVDWDPFGG